MLLISFRLSPVGDEQALLPPNSLRGRAHDDVSYFQSMVYDRAVAPFAGAWIETDQPRDAPPAEGRPLRGGVDRNGSDQPADAGRRSPPSRGRGSKHILGSNLRGRSRPLRGGVDRNSNAVRRRPSRPGRPLRGGVDRNWCRVRGAVRGRRRPLRGGVDRNSIQPSMGAGSGRPLRGGVDRNCLVAFGAPASGSRPLRGGVDRNITSAARRSRGKSPPSRGRGSKRRRRARADRRGHVAPFAGAWIETSRIASAVALIQSPPSRGVDRNYQSHGCDTMHHSSPPSRGRESKRHDGCGSADRQVAPFAGAWIETSPTASGSRGSTVAPFAGAWIETLSGWLEAARLVAPFAGAWIETACCSPDLGPHGRPLRGGVDRNVSMPPSSADVQSRPLRGGVNSKPVRSAQERVTDHRSPPSRGRGSKRRCGLNLPRSASRPPWRGVDGERWMNSRRRSTCSRRPLRGGVDRKRR